MCYGLWLGSLVWHIFTWLTSTCMQKAQMLWLQCSPKRLKRPFKQFKNGNRTPPFCLGHKRSSKRLGRLNGRRRWKTGETGKTERCYTDFSGLNGPFRVYCVVRGLRKLWPSSQHSPISCVLGFPFYSTSSLLLRPPQPPPLQSLLRSTGPPSRRILSSRAPQPCESVDLWEPLLVRTGRPPVAAGILTVCDLGCTGTSYRPAVMDPPTSPTPSCRRR